MDRKKLALGVFAVLAVAMSTALAGASDVALTSDGKVPAQPFQVLQQQMDDVQAQLNIAEPTLGTTGSPLERAIACRPGRRIPKAYLSPYLEIGRYMICKTGCTA